MPKPTKIIHLINEDWRISRDAWNVILQRKEEQTKSSRKQAGWKNWYYGTVEDALRAALRKIVLEESGKQEIKNILKAIEVAEKTILASLRTPTRGHNAISGIDPSPASSEG